MNVKEIRKKHYTVVLEDNDRKILDDIINKLVHKMDEVEQMNLVTSFLNLLIDYVCSRIEDHIDVDDNEVIHLTIHNNGQEVYALYSKLNSETVKGKSYSISTLPKLY